MAYSTVVADPPWLERGGGKIKRGADRHYTLMRKREIITLMKKWMTEHGVEENAHMYLWVTNNHLKAGIEVMEACGFRYVTNIVWIKPHFGIGQYFRGMHELCLFGVKGKGYEVRTKARNLPSAFQAPKGQHSRKPLRFYEVVEDRSFGPYLYMFSRSYREEWTMLGQEKGIFDDRKRK